MGSHPAAAYLPSAVRHLKRCIGWMHISYICGYVSSSRWRQVCPQIRTQQKDSVKKVRAPPVVKLTSKFKKKAIQKMGEFTTLEDYIPLIPLWIEVLSMINLTAFCRSGKSQSRLVVVLKGFRVKQHISRFLLQPEEVKSLQQGFLSLVFRPPVEELQGSPESLLKQNQ